MIEPLILSAAAVSIFFFITLPLVEGLWEKELRQAWRKRLEVVDDFVPPLPFRLRKKTILGKINGFLHPIINKGPGQILYGWWQDAGFGSQPLPFLGLLIGIIGIGTTAGYFSFWQCLIICVLFIFTVAGLFCFSLLPCKGAPPIISGSVSRCIGAPGRLTPSRVFAASGIRIYFTKFA